MPQVLANGLMLEYETFGRREAPAMLLIMGLGAQLTLWPDRFCKTLADAGYYVIRYDNRDVGLSSKLDSAGKPRLVRAGLAFRLGLPVKSCYTLDDMAQDAVGLLDALKIRRAHIVGASMGGMIAQILAAKFAERVRGLVLVMTSSGNPRVPGPSLKVGLRLVKRPSSNDRETLINHSLCTRRMVGSPGYQLSDAEMRAEAERNFDRGHHPRGVARQTLAVLAAGSRVPLLARIAAPTLIIHGRDDCLLPVAAAYDLAAHIRGAKLEVVPGMGHDLPAQLIPQMAASVLRHVGSIERRRTRVRATPLPRVSAVLEAQVA